METEKQKGKRPASENENLTQFSTPTKRSRVGPKSHPAEGHRKNKKTKKRAHTATDNRKPTQNKPFTIITNKVITTIEIKGVRAPDELAGPNKGKIRLLPRADEKRHSKGKREGSRHRAKRAAIVNEMTTEKARNTEVSITKTGRGRYGNAHIRYDINDGLVDILLEVISTEEQKQRG